MNRIVNWVCAVVAFVIVMVKAGGGFYVDMALASLLAFYYIQQAEEQ